MSILSGIKILKDLSESELQNLEVFCQERFLNKGEILFEEGDEANSLYLLADGKIEVFKNIDNKKVVLGYVSAEDILGEMALFKGNTKRMAAARALENTRIIILLDFSIKELTKKHPEILEKIKIIIKNREENNKKIIN